VGVEHDPGLPPPVTTTPSGGDGLVAPVLVPLVDDGADGSADVVSSASVESGIRPSRAR